MRDFPRSEKCHGKDTDDKLKQIKVTFEAVAVLFQYDTENGHSLFMRCKVCLIV